MVAEDEIVTIENKNCKDDVKKYFVKEKFVLKILGVSLYGDEGFFYKIYSLIFLGTVSFAYPVLQLGDLFKHDFDVVADILSYEFSLFVGLAKIIGVLKNRIKFIQILNKLEKQPFLSDHQRGGHKEQTLIKECVFITTTQTLIYWILGAITVTGGVTYTLLKRLKSNDYHDWEFTYGPFTILNVTYSPNYEISWFYQNLGMISVGYTFMTIDLITAGVLAHISCQFKMLQNVIRGVVPKFQKLIRRFQDGSEVKVPYKYLKNSLKQVVGYHLAIIGIAKEMEDVFNELLLLICLGTLGMLCFVVYHASQLNDFRILKTMGEGGVMCVQVLVICYWGEQIAQESLKVADAVFQSNFTGTDLKYQKGLMLVLQRSQKSVKLTAGKFAEICIPTFVWIIRTSYSAFMVLRKNNSA